MTLTLITLTTDPLTLTRYLWDGTLHSLSSQDAEWIHHSIRVFEGDFTDPRDLARIVDTCLGLSTCSKCPLWQRPSSPPVPPRGAPRRSRAARHSQSEAQPLGAPPSPWLPELAASQVADSTAFDHAGLWATAYYTHRVIVGSGKIIPRSDQHRSSFTGDKSYAEHVRKTVSLRLSCNVGSVKPEATKSLNLQRLRRSSAKTHPAIQPSADTIEAAVAAVTTAEVAANAAIAAAAAPAATPPRPVISLRSAISSLGPLSLSTNKTSPQQAPSSSNNTQPAHSSFRRARACSVAVAFISRSALAKEDGSFKRQSRQSISDNRSSENRSSERTYVRRMKRRETVFADKTAMKASNTIYDIVSVTKGEVFPTEFFGDLVSVVI